MSLRICNWKHGKRWVYSITYDEALIELHRFAVPIHEEYGVPGHVEAVVGHLGAVRQIGNSSYNGFRHMSGEELRDLIARHVLAACRELGYLGAMSLTDALNRPGDELFWLNRTALHDQYYEPFYSEYDPFRNIRHAQEDGGWIIDYCHCPLERPVHRNKDCSEAQLRRRFETVLSEGGDEVWCAVPEEVIFYHLTRRHARIETEADTPQEKRYRLRLDGLSERVTCRTLTLDADVPAAWRREPKVWVNGTPRPASLARPKALRVTVDVADGMEIAFHAN